MKQQHRPNSVRDAVMIAVVIVGCLCVFGMAMRTSEPTAEEVQIDEGEFRALTEEEFAEFKESLKKPIDDYPERFGKSMKRWGEQAADKLCEEEK